MAARRWSRALVLSLALDVPVAASQTARPESGFLPTLTFASLPQHARVRLEDAYAAARAEPLNPAAAGRLGMLLHAYEQYRSAQRCYRRARELAPRSFTWIYLSGLVAEHLGEHSEATALFRRALELDPDYWPARLRLADALANAGDRDRGEVEYERLTREFPDLALAYYGLARLLRERGAVPASIAAYERTVELEPPFGPAHYALALAYRDAGDDARARSHLDAYRQFGSGRPRPPDPLIDQIDALKGTARDLIAEGARLGRAGLLSQAIELHLQAVAADPADAQAHVNLISLYGRTGQTGEAEAHYRAAIAVGGSLAEAHYNYGVLLASLGRYGAAGEAFRQALATDPFYAQAHHNLAGLLASEGRLDEAAAHYRQALANDPQHRRARVNLARVLVALGQPRQAIEQFRKALVRDDADTTRYLYELSTACVAAGEPEEAARYATQALQSAKAHGQVDLTASIEQSLERLAEERR